MKIIRAEKVDPRNEIEDLEVVNKIIIFDNEHGALVGYDITPKKIPFSDSKNELKFAIREALNDIGVHIEENNYEYFHNYPIEKAYSAPFKVFLDITLRCQLACKFCLSSCSKQIENVPELSLEICEQLINEMGRVGVFMTKLGGGEPLLHPNFWDIVELLKKNNIFVSLSTNGLLIDDEIAKKLKNNNVKVTVSIDGMEKNNDYLRGDGVFRSSLDAVKILKNNNVSNLNIRMNVIPSNFEDVPKLVDIAKELGIRAKFNFCRPSGRAKNNLKQLVTPDDIDQYKEILSYLNSPDVLPYISIDEHMMFDQPISLKKILYGNRICGGGNRSMHINPEGDVSPCVFMGDDYQSGRIDKNGNSFMDHWKFSKESVVLDGFNKMRNINEPDECTNCSRLCHYECPAMRSHFNDGDPSGPDHLCLKSLNVGSFEKGYLDDDI